MAGATGSVDEVMQAFQARCGASGGARIVRAPFRVCPLGAHIDHQGGTVTGLAIESGVTFAWRPRADGVVRVTSLDYPGEVLFQAAQVPPPRGRGFWGDFVAGAASVLDAPCAGIEGVIGGGLTAGGLGSSAAVALAYAVAFRVANGMPLDPWELVTAARRAENRYVGVACGLLDPAVIVYARAGCLTRIDCRTCAVSQVVPGASMPLYTIAVARSGVTRTLADSAYNRRVDECREAARMLGARGGIAAELLCEVPAALWERGRDALPPVLQRRAAHYFGESARVAQGTAAWEAGDLAGFGRLMNASGESSVTHYEAGCTQVVDLWRILRDTPGVYGARFSGGGFGGAVIACVVAGAEEAVEERSHRLYAARHPDEGARFRMEFWAGGPGLAWE